MGSLVIVMVEEVGEGLVAGVESLVGPLVGEGLVESFDFAVGLWPVGSGEFVGGVEAGEGVGEGLAFAVSPGVVGHYPVDAISHWAKVWAARRMKAAQVSLLWLSWISE